MVLNFQNPRFNIICKIDFIFIWNALPGVQRSMKSFREKLKWQNRIMIICLNFLRKENYADKISSTKSRLYKFYIKIYLESFAAVSHLYHLFGIIYFCNLNITLMNNWFISKAINIRGDFI